MDLLKPHGALLYAVVFISLLQQCCGQEAYQERAVNLHNEYRARHQATALILDNTLNDLAIQCAEYYGEQGVIDHSCPHKNGTGENLAAGSGGNWTPEQFADLSTNMWYDEVDLYDYNNPGFSGETGHFTQVVWRNSQRLGFGFARINGYFVGVALYDPPGNFLGQFEENVLPP